MTVCESSTRGLTALSGWYMCAPISPLTGALGERAESDTLGIASEGAPDDEGGTTDMPAPQNSLTPSRLTDDKRTFPLRSLAVYLVTLAVALAVGAGVASAAAHALTPTQIGRCLDSTGHSALSTSSILQGMVLTGDQKRELRSRLVKFSTTRPVVDLEGVGLTDEQAALIRKRLAATLAAWTAHPVGWPCPAFVHRQKTMAFVKSQLVYNGFRPAMTFYARSPRQIGVNAIQDGIQYYGTFVRTGGNGIILNLTSTHNGGTSARFTLPFVP